MIDASAAAAGAGKDTTVGPSSSTVFGCAARGLTPTEMRIHRRGGATRSPNACCADRLVDAHRRGDGTSGAGRGRRRAPARRATGSAGERAPRGERAERPGAVGPAGARDPGRRGGSAARADRRVQRRLLVTVRVTTRIGADAGAYYVDPDRHGLATYYLDAGEPPGVWFGKQASAWGLTGHVDPDAFLALVDGVSPTGEALGRTYNDTSVRAYDITFSAPKSVSTLWALGDDRVAGASLAGHDAAVRAVLDFVERRATTRATVDGKVQNVDADGIAVAAFRQHTSRMLDPQLHTHAVVVAKVRIANGRWLAGCADDQVRPADTVGAVPRDASE